METSYTCIETAAKCFNNFNTFLVSKAAYKEAFQISGSAPNSENSLENT